MLTVTTPAADRTLLTTEELRAAAGVSDDTQDATLEAFGARVAAAITGACRVARAGATPPTLRQETLTETLRLDCSREWLVLARRPIVSITSITEDGAALTDDDYEIEAGAGMLRRLCGDRVSWWRCRKVVVAYVAGWDTVPDDLKLAAEKFVQLLWAEQGRDANLKRIRIEGVSEREYWVGPADDPLIPSEVMDLLGDYMNYSVG